MSDKLQFVDGDEYLTQLGLGEEEARMIAERFRQSIC